MFVERGAIHMRDGPIGSDAATAFEYRYTLQLVLVDFQDDPNELLGAILTWLREWQPDLLQGFPGGGAIPFDVDVIDEKTVDLQLSLELAECVTLGEGGEFEYLAEPTLDLAFDGELAVAPLTKPVVSGESLE